MNYFHEYRPDTRRFGAVQLKQKDDIEDLQGFVSLYGYPKITLEQIKKQKGTFGLKEYPLYSNILYLDVDDDLQIEMDIFHDLKTKGLAFEYYSSGKKGGHFHIDIAPMECVGLHDIQYQ